MPIKIPFFKGIILGAERDVISFAVKYGSLPNFYAKAMIDNGSPYTILPENVLKRTRIPYHSTPIKKDKPSLNLGGIIPQLRELGVCELIFRDENNRPIIIKQEIYAGIPSSGLYLYQGLPCFIGKDLLDGHYISIIKSKQGNHLLKED